MTQRRRGRDLRSAPETYKALRPEHEDLASELARAAAVLPVDDAAYVVGSTYATMLPGETRARQGVYYTPPPLVRRLLDQAEAAGVNWATARVLDPACGGGAFLGPVAARMVERLRGCDRRVVVRNVRARLRGMELDPFAAWMSQVFLEATLHQLLDGAGSDLPEAVDVCDSLRRAEHADFDLVIGNPPYGRVSLEPGQREVFQRSLYGHANLYGVFLDLAIRKTRAAGGVIAYVTPTSFLSGEYFKRLRSLLAAEARPVTLDLVDGRTGVFDGVMQETLLAVYRRGERGPNVGLHFLDASEDRVRATAGAAIALPAEPEAPWLLPRSRSQEELATRLRALPSRLADWGYKVSTGPLVWNRYKGQLRLRPGRGTVPLIWAEAVDADGTFSFRAARRNHLPYFAIEDRDEWLLVQRPCVLLQRTTSKEQPRRLIAAELPAKFIDEHGSVTVENHLNMIVPTVASPAVDTATLAAFLNSAAADNAFRCISGSVAVSAYELEAMPVPSATAMRRLTALLRSGASRGDIDRLCVTLYGTG